MHPQNTLKSGTLTIKLSLQKPGIPFFQKMNRRINGILHLLAFVVLSLSFIIKAVIEKMLQPRMQIKSLVFFPITVNCLFVLLISSLPISFP